MCPIIDILPIIRHEEIMPSYIKCYYHKYYVCNFNNDFTMYIAV